MEMAGQAARSAVDRAGESIYGLAIDHYNELAVKEAVLSMLSQIRNDTKALRNADFQAAVDQMEHWRSSTEPMESKINVKRLERVEEHATKAFNLVEEAVDKITCVSLIVYATYHLVALEALAESPQGDDAAQQQLKAWTRGKNESQSILRQYQHRLPQVQSAICQKPGIQLMFQNKQKKETVIQSFQCLRDAVYGLPPHSENSNHPPCPWNHTLAGHSRGVYCCAVFANGCRLASGSQDKTIKVWDLSTGKVLQTLGGHSGSVLCCAVFANDTKLVSGSGDKTLRVWDLSTGKVLQTLVGHSDVVYCCGVFADDTKIISGSQDKTLKVWDLSTGQVLQTLEGHSLSVACCAVFANDTKLASGSADKTLKVWDLSTGTVMQTLVGHSDVVYCCAIFANDTKLVSGSADKTLKVWDLSTGKVLQTLEGHSLSVACCAVFANDTKLVSGSWGWDKTLKVWDLSTGKVLHTLEGHLAEVRCCAVFANNSKLVSGSWDETLKVWDLESISSSKK